MRKLKKINSGIFKGLYENNAGFITPIVPEDFPFNNYGQDKKCTLYYDGCGNSSRTFPCIVHDFMCSQAKTIKERFIADLVLAYNVKHIGSFWNKYFHFWFMSCGTIPYGFVKYLFYS
jgi:hypothetical protein